METTNKKLADRITNAELIATHNEVRMKHSLGTIATTYGGDSYDNAELIAEAFNVTNETGLSPRELLNERNELRRALEEAVYGLNLGSLIDKTNSIEKVLKSVKEVMKKVKQLA